MLIGQRKRLLSYVRRKDVNRYNALLISSLGLRKIINMFKIVKKKLNGQVKN